MPVAAQGNPSLAMDFEEDDLRDIFLEEAREVTGHAVQAITSLASHPEETEQLTVLRRAFHTLKGSARMVGLNEFGEAAWAMEQLLNSWLADQKTATKEFRTFYAEVISGFERWIDDIAANQDGVWSAVAFCSSAEAMRIEGRYVALNLSAQAGDPFEAPSAVDVHAAETAAQADAAFEAPMEFDIIFDEEPVLEPGAGQAVAAPVELAELDFDSLCLQPSEGSAPLAATDSAEEIELPQVMADPETAAVAGVGRSIEEQEEREEDAIKVIDGLRIGIPLYNVYLSEADEWSRRLVNEVAEWALESHQPVSASTVALAHSLAGSSATVGFMALSGMARALEHALQNSRNHHSQGASAYGQLFVEASEDIRRLLHQFAAGFLKEPQPDILERLTELEFSDSVFPEAYEDQDIEAFADVVNLQDGTPGSMSESLRQTSEQAEPVAQSQPAGR